MNGNKLRVKMFYPSFFKCYISRCFQWRWQYRRGTEFIAFLRVITLLLRLVSLPCFSILLNTITMGLDIFKPIKHKKKIILPSWTNEKKTCSYTWLGEVNPFITLFVFLVIILLALVKDCVRVHTFFSRTIPVEVIHHFLWLEKYRRRQIIWR